MSAPQTALLQDSSPLSDTEPLPLNNLRAAPPAISQSVSQVEPGSSTGLPQMPVHRVRKGQTLDAAYPSTGTSQPAPALSSIDSPFQLQELLGLLIRKNPHDVQHIVAQPDGDHNTIASAAAKGKMKEASPGDEESQPVDTDVWIYEQLRRIVLDFSTPWLTSLQSACSPAASPDTCSAMNTSNWMYLCASHGEEKQCCAIDYIIHTIDGTIGLLNSTRHFPSRTYIPSTSLTHFGSIARRLSRVFSHAMSHHREVYDACESETSLYARFYALCERFDLCDASAESLPRPASIFGVDAQPDVPDEYNRRIPTSVVPSSTARLPKILQRDDETEGSNLQRSDSSSSRVTAYRISRDATQGVPESTGESTATGEGKAVEPAAGQES